MKAVQRVYSIPKRESPPPSTKKPATFDQYLLPARESLQVQPLPKHPGLNMSESDVIGTLVVVFIKARNLPNRRTLNKQSPYCIGRVHQTAQRTASDIRGGQTPSWDHEVRFEIRETIEYRTMKLSVLDENESKPELIGDCIIDLNPALAAKPSEGYDKWHNLTYKKKFAGEVYIEMTYYPLKPAVPKKPKAKKKKKQTPPPVPVHELNISMASMSLMSSTASSATTSSGSVDFRRPLPFMPGSQSAQSSSGLAPAALNDREVLNNRFMESQDGVPTTLKFPQGRTLPVPPATEPEDTPQEAYLVTDAKGFAFSLPEIPEPPIHKPVRRKPVGSEPSIPGVHTPQAHDSFDDDDDDDYVPFNAESFSQPSKPPTPAAGLHAHSLPDPAAHMSAQSDSLVGNSHLLESTYAPEPDSVSKFELPDVIPEPGIGGYVGEGQWDLSRQINDGYGDSVLRTAARGHTPPLPPPKIPLNMSREEYLAVEYGGMDDEDRILYYEPGAPLRHPY